MTCILEKERNNMYFYENILKTIDEADNVPFDFEPLKRPMKPFVPQNPWDKLKPCLSPSHNFPSMLYVRPGESYTHTCPSCGHQITVRGRQAWC